MCVLLHHETKNSFKTHTTMDQKKNLSPETWRMIIQIAITVLTAISGMFAEAQTGNVAMLLGV